MYMRMVSRIVKRSIPSQLFKVNLLCLCYDGKIFHNNASPHFGRGISEPFSVGSVQRHHMSPHISVMLCNLFHCVCKLYLIVIRGEQTMLSELLNAGAFSNVSYEYLSVSYTVCVSFEQLGYKLGGISSGWIYIIVLILERVFLLGKFIE